MAKGAKQKGDGYERELAEYFNQMMHAGDKVVTRTPLSGGGIHTGKGDLEGLRYLSVEAKRTERFTPGPAMEQATAAAGDTKIPVVITRRNRVKTGDSWVMLKLDDFIPMYEEWARKKYQGEQVKRTIYEISPTDVPFLRADDA